jgi:dTDP-4-amino-4,6-dideoxygalactose transaminase
MAVSWPDDQSEAMAAGRLIGGFFELDIPSSPHGGLWALWDVEPGPTFAFANARSAFAALITALMPVRVWLPAYICRELAEAVPTDKLAFYPVDDNLTPDVPILAASARAGDIVLAVNFFGRPPAPEFIAFADERSDLCVVEDCAQSIGTGGAAWGHWRLYSPRKLVGVPDGGLLVATRLGARACVETVAAFDVGVFGPALRRFEDDAEMESVTWHAANQERERRIAVSRTRMSRLSRRLLELLDPGPIIRRRKENFAVLQQRLSVLAFMRDRAPPYVPFGFPIRVPRDRRDATVAALATRGIFAARHWCDLPSPAEIFAREHGLAQELITLPCDQRYEANDMLRVAAAVEDALS